MGDPVEGMWTNGTWYPGRIGKLNADGTYLVNYNDGDVSKALPLKKVRARKVATTSAVAQSGRASVEPGAACSGGQTMCGGSCVDLSSNTSNCGACGNSCNVHRPLCNAGACDCYGIEKDNNGGSCPE